jgi:hypothetical protein
MMIATAQPFILMLTVASHLIGRRSYHLGQPGRRLLHCGRAMRPGSRIAPSRSVEVDGSSYLGRRGLENLIQINADVHA